MKLHHRLIVVVTLAAVPATAALPASAGVMCQFDPRGPNYCNPFTWVDEANRYAGWVVEEAERALEDLAGLEDDIAHAQQELEGRAEPLVAYVQAQQAAVVAYATAALDDTTALTEQIAADTIALVDRVVGDTTRLVNEVLCPGEGG